MALTKLLILRRPPPGPRVAGPEDRLRGRLEGRTTLIQAPVDFVTASFRRNDERRRRGGRAGKCPHTGPSSMLATKPCSGWHGAAISGGGEFRPHFSGGRGQGHKWAPANIPTS